MNQEKVSVIVPIYNVEAYINRCLDSLVGQTYQNIEIIMVDDCSTDSSAEIAKKYAAQHPEKFRFVQREKNGGLSAARNTGIDHAAGEWLAFVDSDDWVTEDYISAMYEAAQQDGADMVINCSRYLIDDHMEKQLWDICPQLQTLDNISDKLVSVPFSANGKLYATNLFEENKMYFPEDIWRCEDISTVIPLMTCAKMISIIHKPHYFYYQRLTSLSNTNHKNVDTSFYPKTIQRMIRLSRLGFEKELEFRAISELMYGMIMIMIRSEKSKDEILRQIDWFNQQYPSWKQNSYLPRLRKGKRFFIFWARRKRLGILKLLIYAWDRKQKSSR